MASIRTLIAPRLAHGSKMSAEESAALAGRIEGEVGTIVTNYGRSFEHPGFRLLPAAR